LDKTSRSSPHQRQPGRDNVDIAQAPPIEASEDLSEPASEDSESRSKIEAPTGVRNEQEQ
jgi:hypothetical protein